MGSTCRTHVSIIVGSLLLAISGWFGCSRGDLTRSAALDRINHSAHFTNEHPEIPLSAAQFECGVRAGLWKNVRDPLFLNRYHCVLTPRGKTIFGDIRYSSSPFATVQLSDKYQRTAVQITGIADADANSLGYAGKEVQFDWKWQWSTAPEEVKRCVPSSEIQKGTALFRRYDDGWRVEQIMGHD